MAYVGYGKHIKKKVSSLWLRISNKTNFTDLASYFPWCVSALHAHCNASRELSKASAECWNNHRKECSPQDSPGSLFGEVFNTARQEMGHSGRTTGLICSQDALFSSAGVSDGWLSSGRTKSSKNQTGCLLENILNKISSLSLEQFGACGEANLALESRVKEERLNNTWEISFHVCRCMMGLRLYA